jgi:ribonuclease J
MIQQKPTMRRDMRPRTPNRPGQMPRPNLPQAGPQLNSKHTASRQNLRIIPFGGQEEIGMNMLALELGNEIIIVDMGLTFPDESTPGIDYIIPDVKYLEERKKNIKGVFLTHGHLDHVGAVPYLLSKLGDPAIYTLQLTAGLIKKRLEDFNLQQRAKINVVGKDDAVRLGNFTVRFFGVNHNIPDSVGLSITTPFGQIIHTGDWKLDHTPVNEQPAELSKLARYGNEGVLALLSDSSNAIKPGYSLSEQEIGKTIAGIFAKARGRIIFATFSSLITRLQQVFDLAAQYDRKVIITGRALINNLEVALSLGYLKIQPKIIIKSEQASKYPDNQILILTMGGQGEEALAIDRIAKGEHKTVKIKPGDTAVISASPIADNDRSIVSTMDNLIRQGAEVIYDKTLDVHHSGHAQQEELKLMLRLTKPKYFIPVHGEHHMLTVHGKLATTLGLNPNNVYLMENGSVLELSNQGQAKLLPGKIPTGHVFIDGLGVGDVGEVVIRDRQLMAQDGLFVIIMSLDRRNGKMVGPAEIYARGFVYMKNTEELMAETQSEVTKLTSTQGSAKVEPNWAHLRQLVRDHVGDFVFKKTERRPMILPVVIEV